MLRHCPNLAKDVQVEDFLPTELFAYPKGTLRWQHGTFLAEAEVPTRRLAVSFKRLTAEEREELENMKSSRFDQQEHAKGGPSGAGDNGDAVPLGFLSSVPGVSSLAGSSYVLSAVQYAKDNPLMALWTVGPAVCSGLLTAARSTYNYFYPPEQSWLGGWDAGLLGGVGSAGGAWFGGSTPAASSWWPGSQPQASSGWFGFGSQPAPASSSWFGGGEAAASSSSWFGTSSAAAGGAAAGGAAGGWFGGLFGGSEKASGSSSSPQPRPEGDASGEGGFDMEDEFDMDLGGDDDEGCEQQ